jgi:hypothetical protein
MASERNNESQKGGNRDDVTRVRILLIGDNQEDGQVL